MNAGGDTLTVLGRVRRAQVWLGAIAVVVGLVMLFQSRLVGFSDDAGAFVGWPSIELALVSTNILGAVLFLGLAVVALVAALVGARLLLYVSIVGYALLMVQAVVQAGDSTNWFGARGASSASLALLFAVGFFALERGEAAAVKVQL